jgi:Metallo-beta-lactamase superfamily
MRLVIKQSLLFALLLASTLGSAQVAPGNLDVHWNEGAADCAKSQQPPLQVHAYEPQTYILRQNPCADFEANFLYLLIGSDKALLIDTGAVGDRNRMPLADTVMQLLPNKGSAKLPLLVVHTHKHLDHRAGDAQFIVSPACSTLAPTSTPYDRSLALHNGPKAWRILISAIAWLTYCRRPAINSVTWFSMTSAQRLSSPATFSSRADCWWMTHPPSGRVQFA